MIQYDVIGYLHNFMVFTLSNQNVSNFLPTGSGIPTEFNKRQRKLLGCLANWWHAFVLKKNSASGLILILGTSNFKPGLKHFSGTL